MKIIILGAGRVGQSVADSLVSERNDITVIDTDAERLRDLESRFDLRGVVGNGIEPAVLAEAGAQDTDLLIACAAQDETNLVCCKVAQLMFNIPTRIARVRSTGFQRDERCWWAPRALRWTASSAPRNPSPATSASSSTTPRPCRCVSLRAAGPAWCRCGRGLARPWWATPLASCARSCPMWPCAWWPFTGAFRTSPTALWPALAKPASSRATRCLCWPRASTLPMCWPPCTAATPSRCARCAAS